MDQGHIETEKLLVALERKIKKVYGEASKGLQKKADAYFAAFIERDKKQQELLKAGKITEQEYKNWRLAQMGRGERFNALRDDLANRMTEANKAAVSYINDETPGIYSLNHNYAAYTIEQVAGNVGFTLYDEQTVKRLIAEDPTLLPKRRVDAPKDLKWNKKQFTAEITAGILQGESIGKIANRVQNLSDANRSGAIRNARTAVTGAQNAGRQESYNQAKKMGLQLQKRWIATKDGRTRHAHAMLDGQTVALDKPFEIEGHKLMFPGDPTGLARLVWNCRCTMRTVEKEGIEAEPRQMRVRDPETGRNVLVSEMTYSEWENWKKSAQNIETTPVRGIIKERNMASGFRQSPFQILNDAEIEKIQKEAEIIGIPQQILVFNVGGRTGFSDLDGTIHVRGDIFPDTSSKIARDRMSERAVLAHEYYGHYMNDPSEYDIGDWRDEYRASRDAAIHTPNLTEEDRALLMIDAYDRAKEAGKNLEYDEEANKIIYGY